MEREKKQTPTLKTIDLLEDILCFGDRFINCRRNYAPSWTTDVHIWICARFLDNSQESRISSRPTLSACVPTRRRCQVTDPLWCPLSLTLRLTLAFYKTAANCLCYKSQRQKNEKPVKKNETGCVGMKQEEEDKMLLFMVLHSPSSLSPHARRLSRRCEDEKLTHEEDRLQRPRVEAGFRKHTHTKRKSSGTIFHLHSSVKRKNLSPNKRQTIPPPSITSYPVSL